MIFKHRLDIGKAQRFDIQELLDLGGIVRQHSLQIDREYLDGVCHRGKCLPGPFRIGLDSHPRLFCINVSVRFIGECGNDSHGLSVVETFKAGDDLIFGILQFRDKFPALIVRFAQETVEFFR